MYMYSIQLNSKKLKVIGQPHVNIYLILDILEGCDTVETRSLPLCWSKFSISIMLSFAFLISDHENIIAAKPNISISVLFTAVWVYTEVATVANKAIPAISELRIVFSAVPLTENRFLARDRLSPQTVRNLSRPVEACNRPCVIGAVYRDVATFCVRRSPAGWTEGNIKQLGENLQMTGSAFDYRAQYPV